ncbi:MAG: thiamine-phosphate kinase [Candidatus Ratteibacteria bacterium]
MEEEKIINWLKSHCLPKRKEVKIGIGDDTAVINFNKTHYLLLTTDAIVENVHFKIDEASFYQIGWKALGVNISDIAAMGGTPRWALVSLGISKRIVSKYKEIYRGIHDMAKLFNVDIIGGNLSRSEILFVDVFLAGTVKKKNLVLRSTANPGDILFVTGHLGGSQKRKQFEFIPRVREAQTIINQVKPTAMIDLSDGLAADAKKLAEASGCGLEIEISKIPVSRNASEENKIASALYDGEDYELLLTISPESLKFVPASIDGVPLTAIGKLTKKKTFILKHTNGSTSKISKEKFRHFE